MRPKGSQGGGRPGRVPGGPGMGGPTEQGPCCLAPASGPPGASVGRGPGPGPEDRGLLSFWGPLVGRSGVKSLFPAPTGSVRPPPEPQFPSQQTGWLRAQPWGRWGVRRGGMAPGPQRPWSACKQTPARWPLRATHDLLRVPPEAECQQSWSSEPLPGARMAVFSLGRRLHVPLCLCPNLS